MQLKRKAKLPTVIGLTTKHEDDLVGTHWEMMFKNILLFFYMFNTKMTILAEKLSRSFSEMGTEMQYLKIETNSEFIYVD